MSRFFGVICIGFLATTSARPHFNPLKSKQGSDRYWPKVCECRNWTAYNQRRSDSSLWWYDRPTVMQIELDMVRNSSAENAVAVEAIQKEHPTLPYCSQLLMVWPGFLDPLEYYAEAIETRPLLHCHVVSIDRAVESVAQQCLDYIPQQERIAFLRGFFRSMCLEERSAFKVWSEAQAKDAKPSEEEAESPSQGTGWCEAALHARAAQACSVARVASAADPLPASAAALDAEEARLLRALTQASDIDLDAVEGRLKPGDKPFGADEDGLIGAADSTGRGRTDRREGAFERALRSRHSMALAVVAATVAVVALLLRGLVRGEDRRRRGPAFEGFAKVPATEVQLKTFSADEGEADQEQRC
mmetsp:Transcript_11051/g.36327  ORF Transcript_11051/g.36327 Transcript_11051/m.36327 type:complete len:359 (-) Transcript_11051:640-1716(-)